jgi:hypothetical protein
LNSLQQISVELKPGYSRSSGAGKLKIIDIEPTGQHLIKWAMVAWSLLPLAT